MSLEQENDTLQQNPVQIQDQVQEQLHVEEEDDLQEELLDLQQDQGLEDFLLDGDFAEFEVLQPEEMEAAAAAPVLEEPVQQRQITRKEQRQARREAAQERRAAEQQRQQEERRIQQEQRAEAKRQAQEQKAEAKRQAALAKEAGQREKQQQEERALRAKNRMAAEKMVRDSYFLYFRIQHNGEKPKNAREQILCHVVQETLENLVPECARKIGGLQKVILDHVEDGDVGMELFQRLTVLKTIAFEADEHYKQAALQADLVQADFRSRKKTPPQEMMKYLQEYLHAVVEMRRDVNRRIGEIERDIDAVVTPAEKEETLGRLGFGVGGTEAYQLDVWRREFQEEQVQADLELAENAYQSHTAGQYRREKFRAAGIDAYVEHLKTYMVEGMTEEQKQAEPRLAEFLQKNQERCRNSYENGPQNITQNAVWLSEKLGEYRTWIQRHVLDGNAENLLALLDQAEPKVQNLLPQFREAAFYIGTVYDSLEKEELSPSLQIQIPPAESQRWFRSAAVLWEMWNTQKAILAFLTQFRNYREDLAYDQPQVNMDWMRIRENFNTLVENKGVRYIMRQKGMRFAYI